MEYNFDILITGCITDCRHCCVDGGPGPLLARLQAEGSYGFLASPQACFLSIHLDLRLY